MRASALSEFIRTHSGPILKEWDRFASAISSARLTKPDAARDHATGMLQAIADDLERGQTPEQQTRKSRGQGPAGATDTEASLHGAARLKEGFSIVEEVSEFRALRASVQRLWTESHPPPPSQQIPVRELIRFNEAIDQALSESVSRYSSDKERSSRLFDQLLSTSPDLNYIFDANGKIIYANKSLIRLVEIPLDKMLGKTLSDLGASFAERLEQGLQHVIGSGANWQDEMTYTAPSGVERTYEYLLVPVIGDDGEVEAITGTARDVTKRKASEDESRRSANYDSLTGLPNRNLFRERVEWEAKQSRRTGQPFALLFVDLDDFKDINDRLGHHVGDVLLQLAAQRISACVRGIDTVARLGGDEFTVVVSAAKHVSNVELVAGKILAELARPFVFPGQDLRISASIGISFFPRDATSCDGLLRNSDQAMYVAKKTGRNRFATFTGSMRQAAGKRRKRIDQLRQALSGEQLVVHYQPIVELPGHRIVKAEALVRWNHPQAGLLLPGEFISMAEEAGLIGDIDNWVGGEAVRRAREWSILRGAPFQVSVNKSPLDFVGEAAIESAGEEISVEITEAVLLSDSPRTAGQLAHLLKRGAQLTIDDFGTGYASAVELKKFGVDYLKIAPFAPSPAPNVDSRVIAESVIVMAHKLGLKVIAEGVETEQQMDWLQSVDCDFAQGYFFSAPLPPQAFGELLQAA